MIMIEMYLYRTDPMCAYVFVYLHRERESGFDMDYSVVISRYKDIHTGSPRSLKD